MESRAERYLDDISTRAESLSADFEFMREFGLNQTRKHIEDIYGKELARLIIYEDFSLKDLADFQEEQRIELDDDHAYGKIANILSRVGNPDAIQSEFDGEDISREELPIELLFAVSFHFEMEADQLEDNRNMPTVDLINAYLDMRIQDIDEEREPTDEEMLSEL